MPWVYHPQLESLAVPQQPESCPMAAAVTQPESPAMAGVDRLRLDGAMPPSYPSSWSVLPREVVVVDEIDDGEELRRWNILRCDRRAGYGVCEAVVEGVKLGARVVSDRGFSALCIIVSKAARAGTRGQVCAAVLAIKNHVIVLSVSFPRGDLFHSLKCACSSFYLVYDASDASITMIPDLQFSFHHHKVSSAVTKEPLPIACGVAHYLVLLGRAMTIKGMDQHIEDRVCLSPLQQSSLAHPSPSSSTNCSLWMTKSAIFPKEVVTRGFSANKMLSFDGLAMWVDLHQGILFCQHYDLFSNSNDSGSVPFYCVDLPPGCCNDDITTRPLSDSYPPEMYRSIVCVGDSIKFVTIEGYLRDSTAPIEDRMVTMWSLRPQESWSWRKDRDLSIGGICAQLYKKIPICATMLEPMPNMAPQSPILITEDGSLHLLIVNDNSNEMLENQNIMVTVDMSKGYVISACLLPTDFGDQLPGLYGVMLPRMLGSNFFRF
uniref:DUF1618 domain-containing protein n=1 Tax=Oryza nivara TaxID=4536 RepID=A0A0E0IMJ4_ORYNI